MTQEFAADVGSLGKLQCLSRAGRASKPFRARSMVTGINAGRVHAGLAKQ